MIEKRKITWITLPTPHVTGDGYNTFATYKIAVDNWGIPFATVQGYLDPNEEDYNIADDNFICYICENPEDEFCGQGGYPTVAEAVEAIEFIAANGEAPKGFYAC